MEKLYTVKKTRPGADCGSDHELLIAKFRLKLKKVGKTTGPFRYDLNQIPDDYTVEVRNRLKGLDLIERVPDELWTEVHDIVQETGSLTIPMEKKCKKAIWVSGEALQIVVKRREAISKGEKERYKHLNALIAEEGFLIYSCYSLEFCIQMFISFLFSFAFHFSSSHSYLLHDK